jgi:dCTP deaminase
MLLTYNELRELVESGAIEGVAPEQINGASIDLTLGEDFFLESAGGVDADSFVSLNKKQSPRMCAWKGTTTLEPGEFCLAHTRERFNLPMDVAGHYMLKSSLARSGLQHLFAGFADPGWHGSVLTLELVNVLRSHTLILEPGMKIGQMVFWRGSSPVPFDKSYAARGQYNQSTSVQASKGLK